jgi:thiosulfate/3-mercaptopyruvate sulfurtransferase
MKRVLLATMFAVTFLGALMVPSLLHARDVAPIVSTDWLEKNVSNPKVKIVDIRKVEEYKEGHVANAVNVFYNTWAIKKKDLDNELPEDDDLADIIGSVGITTDSWVVIVGKADTATDQVNLTRVGWTLKYAGVENVAILDGAYNKWVADKKPVSMEAVKPQSADFKPKWNKQIVVTKDYVLSAIGKSGIIDTRMPDFYFGVSKLDFVARAGHIKSAVSLPSPWIFTKEGAFKGKDDLEAMAAGVIGMDKSKELVIYCDTGRLCSGWWWVLSEILSYKNVKAYDGSSQDWAKDASVPMVKYSWQ